MENFHLQNRLSWFLFFCCLQKKKKEQKPKIIWKRRQKLPDCDISPDAVVSILTLKWIITPISGLHARISLVSRTPCPCRLQSSKVNTRTRCPSVPPGSTCRPSTPCSGAACPTLSSRWRRPGSARGTAGSSSAWSPCRCWRCTYQRRTGAANKRAEVWQIVFVFRLAAAERDNEKDAALGGYRARAQRR